MPYNGSGEFTPSISYVSDKNAGIGPKADRFDTNFTDVADGLSNAICRDGQSIVAANIPFASRKITFLGDATSAQDAVNLRTAAAGCILAVTYGVKADGTTDDTTAVQNAEAAAAAGQVVVFPSGTIKITDTITITRQRPAWRGAGPKSTVFSYAGANNKDIIVVGNGTDELIGAYFTNFRVTSTTTMVSGYAFRAKKCGRIILNSVYIEGQDGTPSKLYHGMFFDGVDVVYWSDFEACASQTAVLLRGIVGTGLKSDFFAANAKISSSNIGVHIGGAWGGTFFMGVDIIANNTNVLVDESLSAEANREIMFNGQCAIDSAISGQNFKIDCPSDMTNSWIQFDGTWVSSSVGTGADPIGVGIWIKKANNASILIAGGRHYNNQRDAIRIDDTSALVYITDCYIEDNGGYGINPPGSSHATVIGPCCFNNNTSGDVNVSFLNNSNNICKGTVSSWWQLNTEMLAIDGHYRMLRDGDGFPIFEMDSGDYLQYNRTNGDLVLYTATVPVFTVKSDGRLKLAGQTSDPSSPVAGQIYFNSSTGKFRGYTGSAWQDFN